MHCKCNAVYLCIVSYNFLEGHMTFELKSDKKETENKTIRFPVPLINRIENALQGRDVTFSGFVIQACEYALNNLDNNKEE